MTYHADLDREARVDPAEPRNDFPAVMSEEFWRAWQETKPMRELEYELWCQDMGLDPENVEAAVAFEVATARESIEVDFWREHGFM